MSDQSRSRGPRGIVLCVGAVVLRAGAVLLVRQSSGSLKGLWSIPWGFVEGRNADGMLDPPEHAAVRETLEEGGVHARVRGLLGVQNHASSRTGEPRLYLLFLCDHLSGEPTPDGLETDRAEYVTLDELVRRRDDIEQFCFWLARRVMTGSHRLVPPCEETPYRPHLAFL